MASPRKESSESPSHIGVTNDEENDLLDTFRMHMSICFPFVMLGNTSATTLRVEKPFLFATIILGASVRKVPRQTSAGRRLLRSFSEQYLLDGQKSLDLLQAILVHIQWCNFKYRNNPQISILIQLAVSLVAELGLNQTPRPRRTKNQQEMLAATSPPSFEDQSGPQNHSSEEMRAFLGCFYLSSIIHSSFQKVEPMAYVPYIEECCNALEHCNEFLTDVCLVKLVRTQVLVEKMEQTLPNKDLEPLWSPMTPVGMVVKALEGEIEKIYTLDMQANVTFLLHYYSFQISLYKVGLCAPPEILGPQNFPQLELLYSCLHAIKAYFETFFLIPTDFYFTLPAVIWIQLANTIIILARLLLIDAVGWDLSHARKSVDLGAIFSRLESNFLEACSAAQRTGMMTEDESIFYAHAMRMRWGKNTYDAKLMLIIAKSQQVATSSGQGDPAIPGDFALQDDSFWQESILDWGDFGFAGAY